MAFERGSLVALQRKPVFLARKPIWWRCRTRACYNSRTLDFTLKRHIDLPNTLPRKTRATLNKIYRYEIGQMIRSSAAGFQVSRQVLLHARNGPQRREGENLELSLDSFFVRECARSTKEVVRCTTFVAVEFRTNTWAGLGRRIATQIVPCSRRPGDICSSEKQGWMDCWCATFRASKEFWIAPPGAC